MNTTISERATSGWEQYELHGRERADAAGEPVERLAGPGVLYPMVTKPAAPRQSATFALVTGRQGRLRVRNLSAGGAPVPLDLDDLWQLWAPESVDDGGENKRTIGGVVVVPDRGTARSLIAAAAKGHGPVYRALRLCDALRSSSRFVVLTEALSRKYFLPTGLVVAELVDWASAFAFGSPRSAKNIPAMLDLAYGGYGQRTRAVSQRPDFHPKAVNTAVRQESALVQYAAGATLTSDCSRYGSMEAIDAVWTFITDADPIDRDRARLSGTVFSLTRVGPGLLRTNGSFNVRAGKMILPLPPDVPPPSPSHGGLSALVEDVQVNDSGETVMTVHDSRGLDVLLSERPTMDFIQAPYFGRGPSRALRWVERTENAYKTEGRQVPMAVAMAGTLTCSDAA